MLRLLVAFELLHTTHALVGSPLEGHVAHRRLRLEEGAHAALAPLARNANLTSSLQVYTLPADRKTAEHGHPWKNPTYQFQGVPDIMQAVNLGFKFTRRLDTWEDAGRFYFHKLLSEEVKHNPDHIVAYAHHELLSGGCTKQDMLSRYFEIVGRNPGVKVVWGAQLGLFPTSFKTRQADFLSLEERRQKELKRFGLNEENITRLADCADPDAECSDPAKYAFPDSRFVMGTVRALLDHFECMVDGPKEATDQERAAECFLKHKDSTTLDYTGSLAFNTWEFRPSAIWEKEYQLYNGITGVQLCFLHIDGSGKTAKNHFRKKATKIHLMKALKVVTIGNKSFQGNHGSSSGGQKRVCDMHVVPPRMTVHISSMDSSSKEVWVPMGGTPGVWQWNVYPQFQSQQNQGVPNRVLHRMWLEEKVKKHSDTIIIITDRDVMYGGCNTTDLLSRFDAARAHQPGAKVVFGAQLGLWPPSLKDSMDKFSALDASRKKALALRNLTDGSMTRLAECSDVDAECADPVSYSFINAGFAMGRTKDLLDVFKCMTEGPTGASPEVPDQQKAAECMFKHPDDVVLDYAGRLAFSTWEMRQEVLTLQKNASISVSNILNEVHCFVHMNGNDNEGKSYYRLHFAREAFNRDMSPMTYGIWWSSCYGKHEKPESLD